MHTIDEIIKKFRSVTQAPEHFLDSNLQDNDDSLGLVQDIYQFAGEKDQINKGSLDVLPELFIHDSNEEEIWQQLELRNNLLWPQFLKSVADILSLKEKKLEVKVLQENEDDSNVSDVHNKQSEEPCNGNSKFVKRSEKETSKPKMPLSIVDDKFFKLREMEEFLVSEEKKEMQNKKRNTITDINYFDDNSSHDSSGEQLHYKDFFESEEDHDAVRNVKKFDLECDNALYENDCEEKEHAMKEVFQQSSSIRNEDVEKNVYEQKSSFELRQQRINQQIQEYESALLEEKPWQLTGEVQAHARPRNSILETILEFDANIRPPPIITEETTKKLEDIIKQRIKDQAWDDVVRKSKILHTPQEYKKQLVLDQEKSKQSLAQIYEQEYKAQITQNSDESNTICPTPKEHQEIRSLMASLFLKLDALSNFHFVPKPAAPDVKIITNTPAVDMEEVAPVAVSDIKLLAPEEVRKPTKSQVLGTNERSKVDKNRERRRKKVKQKAIHKALEKRQEQKKHLVGSKSSQNTERATALKNISKHRNVKNISECDDQNAVKSSKRFFSKLQETLSVSSKKPVKKKGDKNTLIVKNLKL